MNSFSQPTINEELFNGNHALPSVDQPRIVLSTVAEVLHTLRIRGVLVELLHVLRRKELESLSISTAVGQQV